MKEVTKCSELYQLLTTFDSIFTPSLTEEGMDLSQYSRKLYDQAITFIIQEENDDAGFISFYAGDDEQSVSFITLIAVAPVYQGKHYAQELLNTCIQKSMEMGKTQIQLEVETDNTPAFKFYTRNNFKLTQKASEKSVYMQKDL